MRLHVRMENYCHKYKKRLLLKCIHHFKSDLINNVDHMRISGTLPSSVILSQKKYMYIQKLKRDVPNVPKQAEAKITTLNNFNTSKSFDAFKRFKSTKVDRKTWL